MMKISLSLLLVWTSVEVVMSQADGNPHGWDRTRRCDQQDYDPPCGPCEGVGGIPHGSNNDQIDLTSSSLNSGETHAP